MTDIDISLRQEDAKLIYLAVAHHLGRPGSELDPITKQPVEHGLAEVARALQPQLRLAMATLHLDDNQVQRLQSGMLGSITELKAYSMLQPRIADDGSERRSTVPGFDSTLVHLYPEVAEDPAMSLEIAEGMLMLKRRVDGEASRAVAESTANAPIEPPKRKGWWPFRR